MKELSFKTKKDANIKAHVRRALLDKKFATILLILLIFAAALLATINIKIVQYITSLLVSKTLVSSSTNQSVLYDLLEKIGKSPEEIAFILANYKQDSKFIESIIHELFYDYVQYDGAKLYVELLGLKLDIYNFCLWMVLNIVVVVVLSYFIYLLSGLIARSYETKLKTIFLNKLIDQDLHYFSQNKTGEIITSLVKDTSLIGQYIKDSTVSYIRTAFIVTISSIIMFAVDWKLALCVFGLLVVCMIGVFLFSLLSIKATKNINSLTKNYENEMSEKIYSIRLIKASGTFNQEKTYFENKAKQVDKKNKLKLLLSEIPSGLIIGGVGSFSMASVIFGVLLYFDESQTLISIITTFSSGVIVMTMPLLDLRMVLSQIPSAKSSSENIYKLLNQEITIDKHKEMILNEEIQNIKFKNLNFGYPDDQKVILKDFNLEFEKGKSYAFVGPTGSGKSTIAKFLLRFYDTTTGDVIVNDKFNIKDLNLKFWLDKIGYVDQEPQILSGTIYDNIKYGLNNVTNDQIIEAAKKAKLHDLIMSFENGYETILYERESQLSGGQKQRLVIARLILKNPEILILDEATSALDNKVEKEIQSELEKLMVGRTTFSIAHRLSTIKNFDKIFVIEPNKGVVQSGNYETLIKQEGIFKMLYEISH
ncbi:ABC transporter ATP-binding protein [Spiroplasma tabanidicola]|uniref:ABC transporter ATP-binding protein n=1 Tax=Spiroplasma tabanidicola TaxID=324079 RepID=A0A6I6CD11_9MOLU|nr:ABC transporter ATP-binding protein [Spiroplasma tabanidicola]QGS51864.1 hypothetical protein STABA_v1c05010 [Spiroplasma tabanidicola]